MDTEWTSSFYSGFVVVLVAVAVVGAVCGLTGASLYYELFVIDQLPACDTAIGGERCVW